MFHSSVLPLAVLQAGSHDPAMSAQYAKFLAVGDLLSLILVRPASAFLITGYRRDDAGPLKSGGLTGW